MDFVAGRSVGPVKEIMPGAEVIREVAENARRIVSRLAA
jgi:hypothetical protein